MLVPLVHSSLALCAAVSLTNSADDGGAAVVIGRLVLRIQLGMPLQLHPVGEMV